MFETYGTASIGDIAIHPTNPDIVYVGTGEPNNRQTSTFGDGIYKTTDGGKTFTNIGLKETQTIARIVIDPRNPETVYVASPGHLFGPNPERGIFKTTDGGKTWNKIKFIDDDTGFTDIAIDPSNPSILYAASYQRRRSGCCFNGGGPGSGLWKTTDAGKTWTKLSANGLPPGTYGRIALDVSRSNPNVVYVQIEAGNVGQPVTTGGAPGREHGGHAARRGGGDAAGWQSAGDAAGGGRGAPAQQPPAGQRGAAGGAAGGGGGGGGGGRGGYEWCNNAGPNKGFPVGRGGQAAPATPPQNQTPPPLDSARGGIFRTENKGAGWVHLSNCNSRPMYFSQLRVDPSNDKAVYVAGLPVAKSLDGGRTFATLDESGGHGEPGHVDQHAIWIDPKNPKHIMIGNDGGLDITYDQGKTWDFVNTMVTSLAYWVSADMRRPYYIYTGLQDNGSWGGPSATRSTNGIMNSDWFGIGGGDGFQTAVDPTDFNVVYTESQDGNTSRYDLRSGRGQISIRPRAAGPGGRGGRGAGGGAAAGGGAGAAGGQAGGGAAAAQPGAEAAPPAQFAAAAAAARRTSSTRRRGSIPFQLEHPVHAVAAQPEHRVARRQPPVQVAESRRHLDRERGSDETGRSQESLAHERARRLDAALTKRRSRLLQHDHLRLGIAGAAGRRVGRHRRRQPAGEQGRRRDVHGSRQEHRRPAGEPRLLDIAHRGVAFRCGTAYAAVDGHRDDDLKPYLFLTTTTARRGSRSPAICRRSATSRWCGKIRRTATCSTSAPSSGCSSRSTAGRSGRSS